MITNKPNRQNVRKIGRGGTLYKPYGMQGGSPPPPSGATVTGSVDTDTISDGTLYTLMDTSPADPPAGDVKSTGQVIQAVSGVITQNVTVPADSFPPGTYYLHYVQETTEGFSNVITSPPFSLLDPPVPGDPPIASGTFAPPNGNVGSGYFYATASLFTGGAVVSYALNGTLPTGLSFSTGNGQITGTPTTEQVSGTLSVTATNADGSDTTNTDTLTIDAALPAGTVNMSVGTDDVPYNSLVYGRTVNIGETINYTVTAPKDDIDFPETGNVSVDTLGVPTITGSYGTYPVTFNFNAAGDEIKVVSHIDVDAVEALYAWKPAQDANGYSIIPEPESTGRLLYVDPTSGNDATAVIYTTGTIPGTDWRTDPGAVNAYQNWNVAAANMRDGEGDYLLFKSGETFEANFDTGSRTLQAGKSHTFPNVFCAYGAGERPIFRVNPNFQPEYVFITSTNDNYNHFYGINFWSQYRDPDDALFNGYGDVNAGTVVIRFGAGSTVTPELTGLVIEDCIFRYCGVTGDGAGTTLRMVVRKNVFWKNYSEQDIAEGFFMATSGPLLEDNLFYHNGFLINRDSATYPDQPPNATHTGANGAVTFTTGTNPGYTTAMIGAVLDNRTTGKISKVATVPSSTSLTAYKTIRDELAEDGTETGTVNVTFDTGDVVVVRSAWMRGQGDGQNHNIYCSKLHSPIYRNNLILEGSESGIKLTAIPSNDTDLDSRTEDACIYDNYFAGNQTDLSADLNSPGNDWFNRFLDLRFMNNVCTKTGYNDHLETGNSLVWLLRWWERGCIGGNVVCDVSNPITTSGLTMAYGQDSVVISNNVFADLGVFSGTSANVNRGSVAITNSSGEPIVDLQLLNNDFQNLNTDGKLIGTLFSNAGFTWRNSRYYSLRTPQEWAELDDVNKTITELVADTGEIGYSETPVTYNYEATHEDYMTSIGEGTTTIERMAQRAYTALETRTPDNDVYAPYVTAWFKQGYTG